MQLLVRRIIIYVHIQSVEDAVRVIDFVAQVVVLLQQLLQVQHVECLDIVLVELRTEVSTF